MASSEESRTDLGDGESRELHELVEGKRAAAHKLCV
jgi:hypothetical protein